MTNTKKFYYNYAGNMVECKNLSQYGYFLSGYQDIADTGKLYILALSESGRTCLTPVYDEHGQTPCHPEYAGTELKNLNINLNIL